MKFKRLDQIKNAAYPGDLYYGTDPYVNGHVNGFIKGAQWADNNPELPTLKTLLRRRIKELEVALDFYARGHWNGDVCSGIDTKDWDSGDVARKALEDEG